MNKKISVIMPVYNSAKLVEKGVRSILNQTYQDFELIIVDDGSTDGSDVICDKFANGDDRIKVIHKVNGGPSSARNVGLSHATGEYVYFIDCDDELQLDGLTKLQSAMEKNLVELVICGYNVINKEKTSKINFNSIPNGNIKEEQTFLNILKNSLFASLWNKLYLRAKITHEFNEEIKWGEDLQFNLEYIKNISNFSLIEDPLYNYYIYINENSLTSMSEKKKYEQNLYSLPHRIRLVKELFPESKAVMSETCGNFVNITKGYVKQLVSNCNGYKEVKMELMNVVTNPILRECINYHLPLTLSEKLIRLLLKLRMTRLVYLAYKNKR